MSSRFLNDAVLTGFAFDAFESAEPFPWANLEAVLLPEAFDALLEGFPPESMFEWLEGHAGQNFVRSHDRWFLDFRPDLPAAPGVTGLDDLPEVWADFVRELTTSQAYRSFCHRALKTSNVHLRFNWHRGVAGSEVSPHVDKDAKVGTHIFYFNSVDDWDPAWGGSTLVLSGRNRAVEHPDFVDFAAAQPVANLGNRSFLFRNEPEAWHGVRALDCPPDRQRRLFNAVWERNPVLPRSQQVVRTGRRAVAGVRRRAGRLLGAR